MLKKYLKIALININNQKTFSIISILGLSIGLAVFLLFFGYVQYENSYDTFNKNINSIYRLDNQLTVNGFTYNRNITVPPAAPQIEKEISSVIAAVRFTSLINQKIKINNELFDESKFFFVDKSVFKVFTFPIERGTATLLDEPFSLFISESTSRKYFGNKNPVGKTITVIFNQLNKKFNFKIKGVLKDAPSNSHIKFNFLASYNSLDRITSHDFVYNNWTQANYSFPTWVYILLKNGADLKTVERSITTILKERTSSNNYTQVNYSLLPLSKVYYSNFFTGGMPIGDSGIKQISIILLSLSILVLIVACINYITLSTSRLSTRFKEVGIKKSLGAGKISIFFQFLCESLLYSFIAAVIGIVFFELLLNPFERLITSAYSLFGMNTPRLIGRVVMSLPAFWYGVLISILLIGIISGLYPSILVSRFSLVDIMKGEIVQSKFSGVFRKGLVISQFATSVLLIIVALVIQKQVSHMKNINLGINTNNVLALNIEDASINEKYLLIKQRLLQEPDILSVAGTSQYGAFMGNYEVLLGSDKIKDYRVNLIYIDKDYLKVLGLKLINGMNIKNLNNNDFVLINKRIMDKLGENSNSQVEIYSKSGDKKEHLFTNHIAGVVNNFHFIILNEVKGQPIVLKLSNNNFSQILFKIKENSYKKTTAYINNVFKEFNIQQNVQPIFLKDKIDKSFSMYDLLSTIVKFSTILAFIIAFMGLYALSGFMVERRTKEISIRKVLGASSYTIIYTLSKNFLKYVLIGNIFGWIVAYIIGNSFLQNIPYRIQINIFPFLISLIFSLTIAFFTIYVQTKKVAVQNPVTGLRYE